MSLFEMFKNKTKASTQANCHSRLNEVVKALRKIIRIKTIFISLLHSYFSAHTEVFGHSVSDIINKSIKGWQLHCGNKSSRESDHLKQGEEK